MSDLRRPASPPTPRPQPPPRASDLTGNTVLVIVPDVLDAIAGCGGALALHRRAGDPVAVVVLDSATLHRQDSIRTLGITTVEGLRTDSIGTEPSNPEATALTDTITRHRPSLIYCPSPADPNPGRRRAFMLVWRSLANIGANPSVALIEAPHPLRIDTLVDVSSTFDDKLAALRDSGANGIEEWTLRAVTALNEYRATALGSGCRAAEGFVVCEAQRLASEPPHAPILDQIRTAPDRAGQKALVTIVVRTRDRPTLLRAALDSVVAQSYPNLEVVLVNDGQQDLADIIDDVARILPIRCIDTGGVGRAAAANTGLRAAEGRYVGFLDDDDILFPDHVSTLVAFLENGGARFAYSACLWSRYRFVDGSFQVEERTPPSTSMEFDPDRLLIANFIPFMTALFQRSLADDLGPFDESLDIYEDWDYWIRAAEQTTLHHVPVVTAEYRSFGDHHHDHADGHLRIYRKHGHPPGWFGRLRRAVHWSRRSIRRLEQQNASLQYQLDQARDRLHRIRESYPAEESERR